MGLFDTLKSKFKEGQQKKALEKESEMKIRKEVALQERMMFEKEFRDNLLKKAKLEAKQKAMKSSGLAKLRAQSRLSGLNSRDNNNNNFFSKLGELTQKNRERTRKNLERTRKMREQAEKIRKERMKSNKTYSFGQKSNKSSRR